MARVHLVLALIQCVNLRSAFSHDEYLNETRGECSRTKDAVPCAKYRVLRYISNYTENSFFEGSLGPFRMGKYQDENVGDEETIFAGEEPRYLPDDSEFGKFFKFVKRQVNRFLNHQSLFISLPEGARFVTDESQEIKGIIDSRGKKKKAADLLISLLTLFKVFKIKVLVALALAGILVIKKVLLIGAFILPSIIHNLKMNCMKAAQAAGGAYHHVTSVEADHDEFGGFGAYGVNSNYQYNTQHSSDKFTTGYQRRQ